MRAARSPIDDQAQGTNPQVEPPSTHVTPPSAKRIRAEGNPPSIATCDVTHDTTPTANHHPQQRPIAASN
ncbi:hypothetical protein PtA15_10A414 [Puccinia triticina]|uniref:Uncharacterized protein n=1 Tax=Puccinia triticina TaxID=208348 RepID=A0ABY7CXZ7_9BASI|nr:uncharacterized protein PtA15_10A414 [Puccinia triticina]WAQ88991.1 hypothetical protein PtA15_10A414 [Puccinia triticina]